MEPQMEPEQSTGKALPSAVRLKLGEALRSYFDVLPTLPERLYELAMRVEGNISGHPNRPKIENRSTPRRETPRKHVA
jgi:hypothetical protein